MKSLQCVLVGLCFLVTPVFSGVFLLSDSSGFEPFIVVHPAGYTGTGGQLDVRICVEFGSSTLVPPLMTAMSIWNTLVPTLQNCDGCRLWEEGPSGSAAPSSMESTMLHELGHCAMGIDHINWAINDNSFTNTKDATSIDAGADGVRGSRDDIVSPLPGARLIHWFRIMDNDPFVIDGTVIDSSTFTRVFNDLPPGSSWSASGNRGVGDLLGLTDTQSVMYSGIDDAQRYRDLTADDVNTVRLGMVGLDLLVGGGDDYSVNLLYEADCASSDIEVRFSSLGPGRFGVCEADLALIPTGLLEIHHRIVPASGETRIVVEINQDRMWDVVFANGFEEGNLSQWAVGP